MNNLKINFIISLLILIALYSCDKVKDNVMNQSGSLNTPITIDVLANDNLCASISPSILYIAEQPKNGTITIVEGKLNYTPFAGYTGYDYFSYAVVDDQGNSYLVPVKGIIQ